MTRTYTKTNRSKGFTLVELIVIISVIAILATIGFVSYSGYRTRAAKASVETTVQQVKLKLGEYYTDNNRYPATGNAYPDAASDVRTYLTNIQANETAAALSAIVNHTDATKRGSYTAAPAGCVQTGSPACTGYTITVPALYWGGASGDSAVTITVP